MFSCRREHAGQQPTPSSIADGRPQAALLTFPVACFATALFFLSRLPSCALMPTDPTGGRLHQTECCTCQS